MNAIEYKDWIILSSNVKNLMKRVTKLESTLETISDLLTKSLEAERRLREDVYPISRD